MATSHLVGAEQGTAAPGAGGGAAPVRRRVPWLVLAAAVAGCLLVGLSGPGGGVLPGCPFHRMTGLDCPGCGMTRGLRQLVRGHPLAALGHNVLLAVLVPLAAWAWLASVGGPVPRVPSVSPRLGWALVAVVAAFTVARNLPLPGCRWLAAA